MHCLGARSLLAISLLSLAGIFAAGYATAAGSGPAKSDTRLRELLTRRYEILQKMVETSRLSLEAGRVDVFSHQNLLDALYRAQADLATTTPERVQVYEKLIEALSENERLAERQAEAGRLVTIQVMQVKLVTLNARIDLERLRLGQAAAL
jgi:hypothetical protein